MGFANEYRTEHAKKIILNVGSLTFNQLEQGLKTLEMRLKKGSQVKICVGDIIIFKLQTGEEQKAEDEVACEKKVIAVRNYIGLSSLAEKEDFKKIFPARASKKNFLEKIESHYHKLSKFLDLEACEFEIIEFKNLV